MTRKLIVTTLALLASTGAHAGTITGQVRVTGAGHHGGAVVYVDHIEGETFPPPAEPAVMDQKGKVFVPRILPIVAGTTVEFLNSDPFTHNVFTPDPCPEPFDLGGWTTGESRSHTFGEPCVAAILCGAHPEMDAFVVVLETPYFAVTDEDGTYRIPGVPDGEHTLVVWHERMRKNTTAEVSVAGDTVADFVLKR